MIGIDDGQLMVRLDDVDVPSRRIVSHPVGAFAEGQMLQEPGVVNLIGWLKECLRVFSRSEKTAMNFGGMIKMAFIQRYRVSALNDGFPTEPSIVGRLLSG